MTKMKKRMSRKITTLCIWGLVFLAAATGIMGYMQYRINYLTKYEDIQARLQEIPRVVESTAELSDNSLKAYDKINKAKVSSVSYMARNIPDTIVSNDRLKALGDTLGVQNLIVLDRSGHILLSENPVDKDFTRPVFNQLRTVFDTGEPSEGFFVIGSSQYYRYYAARIDDSREAVIMLDASEVLNEIQDSASIGNMLKNFSSSSDSHTFAVSTLMDIIVSYPDQPEMEGEDITAHGIEPGSLVDGKIIQAKIDGVRYLVGSKYIDRQGLVIVTITPASGNFTSAGFSVTVSVLSMLAALILICFSMIEKTETTIHAACDPKTGVLRMSRGELSGKVLSGLKPARFSVAIVAIVSVSLISYYLQALSSLAVITSYQRDALASIAATSESNNETISDTKLKMTQYSINNAHIAAKFLSNHPDQVSHDALAAYADALNVEQISVYDEAGNEVVNNDLAIRANIANDPDPNVSQFAKMLSDTQSMASDMISTEDGLSTYQYSACVMTDAEGATGFVLLRNNTSSFNEITANAKPTAVFNTVHSSGDGTIIAVRAADGVIVYPFTNGLAGELASDKGITESKLADGYVGYLNLNGIRYFGRTAVINGYDVIALSKANFYQRVAIMYGLWAAACTAAGIILMHQLIKRGYQRELAMENGFAETAAEEESSRKKRGSRKLLRHLVDNTVPWQYKDAHQKTSEVMGWIIKSYAALMTLVILLRNRLFSDNSVIRYVLSSDYEKGFNLFSITASVLIICVVATITMIIVGFLEYVEDAVDYKARTILKLFSSVAKYTAVIITMYYCLALFGMDTKTLLASAGILGLGVSMGSRELVQDIVAGLFIIFEGQFQVGDVVEIMGWKGTVIDIGVRTTKIVNDTGAVKNFSNSSISGLVSQPKALTMKEAETVIPSEPKGPHTCMLSFTAPYGDSVTHLKEVMDAELPKMKDRIPALLEAPVFNGISELTDSGMKFSVSAKCAETADAAKLQKDLLWELLVVFEHNEIHLSGSQAGASAGRPAAVSADAQRRSRDDFPF